MSHEYEFDIGDHISYDSDVKCFGTVVKRWVSAAAGISVYGVELLSHPQNLYVVLSFAWTPNLIRAAEEDIAQLLMEQ